MISQDYLKSKLQYDKDTGIFVWKNSARGIKKGAVAGSISDQGYVVIRIDYKIYRAHRLAWLYMTGNFPKYEIDHINGIRSDNRFENLRDVTRSENKKNVGKYKTNVSGVNGVRWYAPLQKWHVQIQCNSVKIHIGYYSDLNDAISARIKAEVKFNFHTNHGKRDSHENQT